MSAGPSGDQLWGDRDACVTGGPQRTFWGVGQAAGFSHLAGQDGVGTGQGQVTEGLDSTGVWADMLQAQAGAGQGCSEPCTMWGLAPGRISPTPHGQPWPEPVTLGRGTLCGWQANIQLSGKGGGLRACPQPRPWEDSASGGLWASWTVVSPPTVSRSGGGAGPAMGARP